ncbi:MAG: MFS transporter [Oscillospiraceae bacterium]|nr:MFS transporter [Oscillospiraceae bacterium]MCL2278582.1 MFS transporter [Oscillospiraceae bacterium]
MFIYKLFDRSYRDYVGSAEVLRTLNIIVLSAAVGTFLFSAQFGVAFTGYASSLGAGEFVFGLITALPVLASLLQIPASYLAVKTGRFKQIFLIGGVIQRVAWVVIAFIPFLFQIQDSRLWALIVLVTLASMSGSFVAITHMTLMGAVIPMEIRGRYVTTRQKVLMVVSLISGLGFAFLLDNIPGFLGYTIVFGVGGVAGLIDILMYMRVDFSSIPKKTKSTPLRKGIRDCFTKPIMRKYLIFWTFWSFAVNISGPFFNKYAIDVLGLSYMSLIIFGQIMSQVVALLVISRWGVFLDRYGSVPTMMISSIVSTFVGFVWLFAVPGAIWPILIFNMIGGMFWCANDACAVNMQLSHTPSEDRSTALAVYAVITSLAAAAALIVGGAVLELLSPVMEELALSFAGTAFDHYKLVFLIAIVLRFAVIGTFLPRVWNEKELPLRVAYAKAYGDISSRLRYELSRFRLPKSDQIKHFFKRRRK